MDVYFAFTRTHSNHDVWLIDSGASFDMTPHKEWFCEYEKYNGGDVFLGDESTTKITGHGRVKLWKNWSTPRGFSHSDMARKLISISNMSDESIHIFFENETFKMVQGTMVLIRGVRNGTLYKLSGSTITDGCNSSIVLEGVNEEDRTPSISIGKTMLWNPRLGHIGEKGLRALHGKSMVEGMSYCTLDFELSEHFIYGKQNRIRFSSSATRAKGILELIHSDVFGPVLVP
jgi:hypothetical protein